ncbi:enoyl-CoA hydratase/isomerase family protein [Modestobacter sp. DSM 44400]|uniref:enoyl-CoA hydratase/isomerase family protein n=1 Tax=Modestobacter sp. DSM 44400 TaxID=1550230 RepID=UPI001587E618|nr:enoyl-CoA hydratase/isomerase family protein [Modestobacter sp. DSM 44400]
MIHPHIDEDLTDGVAVLQLDRPRRRNALTHSMWLALGQRIGELGQRSDVTAVVLRGRGVNFSAGADLDEVHEATRSEGAAARYCRTIVDTLQALVRCPVPTIAVVHGQVSGGGVELALATDIRLGAADTSMQLPMARLGVIPDAVTIALLNRSVGPGLSRWLLLTGRTIDAGRCLDVGLLHELATDGSVDDLLATVLAELSRASRTAMAGIKLHLDREVPADSSSAAAEMAWSFAYGDVAATVGRLRARPARGGRL